MQWADSETISGTMNERKFDIVVFGATGFTGQLIAEYLSRQTTTKAVQWAIVGRNQSKLSSLERELRSQGAASLPDVVQCDLSRPNEVDDVVRSTNVVISAAGPFNQIGTPIVEACVANGTHYCDITGEIPWVRKVKDRFESDAETKKVKIVNCCGFDSCPSDLGTLFGVMKLRERFGASTEVGKVQCFVVMAGAVSGGTLASGISMEQDSEMSAMLKDPFLLGGKPKDGITQFDEDVTSAEFNDDIKAWTAPFMMAGINTRIVRRSSMLKEFGRRFHFREVALVPSEKAAKKLAKGGPPADKRAEMIKSGRLPKQGEGPSREMMAKSWFLLRLKVETAEDPTKFVWVQVASKLDPGYLGTARMVAEAGLCLARDQLPSGDGGGFFTPASGMGTALIERFERVGVHFSQIDPHTVSKL